MVTRTQKEWDFSEDEVFHFGKGIPGFEQCTKYVFYKHDEDFSLLQSIENKDLAFIVTNPFSFFKIMNLNCLLKTGTSLILTTKVKLVFVRS